jgi:hypothetical protein
MRRSFEASKKETSETLWGFTSPLGWGNQNRFSGVAGAYSSDGTKKVSSGSLKRMGRCTPRLEMW